MNTNKPKYQIFSARGGSDEWRLLGQMVWDNKLPDSCGGVPHLARLTETWVSKNERNPNALFMALGPLQQTPDSKLLATACLTIRENSLYLALLCARNAGVGHGKALMAFVEDAAVALKKRYIELVTVLDPGTMAFYKKLGFVRGPPGTTWNQREYGFFQYGQMRKQKLAPYYNVNLIFDGNPQQKVDNLDIQQQKILTKLTNLHYALNPSSKNKRVTLSNLKSTLVLWNRLRSPTFERQYYNYNLNEVKEHLAKYHKNVDPRRFARRSSSARSPPFSAPMEAYG